MQIKNTLKQAFDKRAALFNNADSNCFRLFNSSRDSIEGLTIDLYGEYLLVQSFDEKTSQQANSRDFITAITEEILKLPINLKGILLKNRLQYKGNHDYSRIRKSVLLDGELPQQNYIVKQTGVLAEADLINGQSTGIFLDMREIRDELSSVYREYSPESILNLFCYTALFSVHALKNNIKHAINIDVSKQVLRRAVRNYGINDLRCDNRDFIRGDSIYWMKQFIRQKRTFRFAVFDPPAFARNSKREFSAKRNYISSLSLLQQIVPEGFVLTCVNDNEISKNEYISYHPAAWKMTAYWNESSDFLSLNNPYLKAGLWEV